MTKKEFGFNSNMVRLREYANAQDVAHEMFQFQYGAIKSITKFKPQGSIGVSIPIWCD